MPKYFEFNQMISEIGTDFSKSTSSVSAQLSNPTRITLNKEIPIWRRIPQ